MPILGKFIRQSIGFAAMLALFAGLCRQELTLILASSAALIFVAIWGVRYNWQVQQWKQTEYLGRIERKL